MRDTGAAFPARYLILECPVCGLRVPDRDPSDDELRGFYSGYGGFVTPERQEADLQRGRRQAARVLAKLAALRPPLPPRGRLLELGCATGAFLMAVARASSFECHGVDLDATSAALAAERLPGRIRVGTLADAAYEDGFFSAVYAEQLIEHVVDPLALLAEIRRVLAPGGAVLLGTPNFEGLGARLLGMRWRPFDPAEHIRMFTRRSLGHHLRRAGFTDIRLTTGGFFLVRRDHPKNLFPFRDDRLLVRVAVKAFGVLGLGDALLALARKPA